MCRATEGLLLRRVLIAFVAVVGCLSLQVRPAQAYTMTLTSAGSNISGGVYIGPYTASIDGTSFPVICDDFTADSYIGETWTANAESFTSLGGTKFGSSATTIGGVDAAHGYAMVGWLAEQLFANASNFSVATNIQYALWSVFSSAALPLSAGAQSWLDQAYAHRNDSLGLYSDLLIFTPTGSTCSAGPCPTWPPQEFIARAPEPATLSLMGLGLAAIAAARRRRRALLA